MFHVTRRFAMAGAACALLYGEPALAQSGGKSPYEGTTIRFLTSSNASQEALAAKLIEIGTSWGMTVDVRKVTTDELQKKVVLDYVAGADTWDLIYAGGVQRVFEWYDRGIFDDIAPMIEEYGDKALLDWDGITAAGRNAVTQGDEILGITVATSDQALAYRADLFSNEEEKAAFKDKYGYELQPPETYQQYHDVAEFFTRKKGETLAGKVLENDFYGISNSNKKGTFLWHDYENQLMAFGAEVCKPDTLEAGLLSPASIEAAEYYKSLIPFWPPDHINMSSGESAALFADGRVAMTIEYFDRVVFTIAKGEGSVTADQVAYTFPPTRKDNPRGLNHPYRAGPAVISVYSLSNNKEAAYKLLEAAASKESQIEMARDHPGFMPARTAALEELKGEMPVLQYLIDVGNGGADALSDADELPYPCILKSSEIGDSVSNAISAILIGGDVKGELTKAQESIQAALDDLKSTLKQ